MHLSTCLYALLALTVVPTAIIAGDDERNDVQTEGCSDAPGMGYACENWKNAGQCQSPGVDIQCSKTCGFCGASIRTNEGTSTKAGHCQYKMDLLFLVDKSGSIEEWQFEKSKEFVAKIVEHMDIGPSETHVALALFASDFHLKFCFDEYTTFAELNETILNLECPECRRGQTVTGVAMKQARKVMLKASCGVRNKNKVPRVVVVITDGKSTEENNGYPAGWLTTQSNKLWVMAATHVIAVGVGPGFDNTHPELKEIATDNDLVFATTDFNRVIEMVGNVSGACCNTAGCGVQTCFTNCPQGYVHDVNNCSTCECLPYVCNKSIDLVFLMDKSGSINETSWQAERHVVTQLITHFDVALDKTRVALNLFDIEPRPVWCFTEYTSNDLLESAVTNLTCPACVRGQTAIGGILEYTRVETLTAGCGARDADEWPRVVVLLTDGRSTEAYPYWSTQADMLRSATNTQVAAIGVGRIRLDHLRLTASSQDLVFAANSFEEVIYIEEIARALCDAAGTTTHLQCLPGWSFDTYSERCYKWFDEEIYGDFEILTAKCASHHGSEPAKILKKGTHYFLKTISSPSSFWLAIGNIAGGVPANWVWLLDTPLEWTNWADGEPKTGTGYCVIKGARGKQRWRREDCDAKHTYVCSLPLPR